MNTQKILNDSHQMACKAKPGFLKLDGKLYTFEFDQTHWVYNIYEGGFLILRVNVKTLTKAKTFLKEWLAN